MNIVREYINFDMDFKFEKNQEPMDTMGLGKKAKISAWLDQMGIEEYVINDDLTIDVFGDANIIGNDLEELPEDIKFDRVIGGFYAGGNPWQSLKGFPNEIYGDLQIDSISNPIEYGEVNSSINMKKIKKLIQVHGKIFI